MIINKIDRPYIIVLAALLVIALALVLIPARTFAATENIVLDGSGVPTAASGTNWEYTAGTLYITGDCTAGTSGAACTAKVVVRTGGILSGGYYSGTVTNNGRISSGTFTGSVTNNTGATIEGGTFSGTVTNNGRISSGTFSGMVLNNPGASFTGGKFTVTLNANEGTPNGSATATYGSDKLNITTSPGRSGFRITGYSLHDSGTNLADADGTLVAGVSGYTDAAGKWIRTSGATLDTQWRLEEYTIRYNWAGGTADLPTTTYDVTSAAITLPDPTRTGYTFEGWSGTGLTGTENKNVTIPAGSTGDREYTANWRANTYDITLNANGGAADGTVTASYGSALPVFTALTRTDHELTGYFTAASGGTKVIDADGTLVASVTDYTDDTKHWTKVDNGTLTLYAQWTELNYSISLSPSSVAFDPRTVGYTIMPDAVTVTVRNTGNSDVVINKITTSIEFGYAATLPITISEGGTYSFTLLPKLGLSVGNHTATVTVETLQSTSAQMQVSFRVNEALTAEITGVKAIENGGSTALTAIAGKGTAPYRYTWIQGATATTTNITVSPTVTTTYTVRVWDNGGDSAVASATVVVREKTPAALFTATDESAGTLSDVNVNMQYSLDGGTSWSSVTGSSMTLTGITAQHGVKLRQPATTGREVSSTQTITVTKADVPTLKAQQPAVVGQKGAIPMTKNVHEYRQSGGTTWTTATGTTEFTAGTYEVRVKASGTMLASAAQTIEIKASSNSGIFTVVNPIVYNDPNSALANIWLEGAGLNPNDRLVSRELLSGRDYKFMLELAGNNSVYRIFDMSLASGVKSTGLPMYMSFKLDPAVAGQSVFTLVHKLANGTVEYFYAWPNALGVVEFGPFYELSPFMLVTGRMDPTVVYVSSDIPRTGELLGANAGFVALSAALAVTLGGVAIYLAAGRGRNRNRKTGCEHED